MFLLWLQAYVVVAEAPASQEKKIVSCNFTVAALSRNSRLKLMRF